MENKTIFVAGLHLESNSFTPLHTRYDDFFLYRGAELCRYLAGTELLMQAGCRIIPGLYATAIPGGEVALEDYLRLVEEILVALPADGGVDGVFLILHGAMEVHRLGSGEAHLVHRIRERVGPRVPIAVAMDLHANNTYTLMEQCNIVTGYRTAPHIDEDETRRKAAGLLLRALSTGALPRTQMIRLPMMLPGEVAMTDYRPSSDIISALEAMERLEGVWSANWFVGMAWADCDHNGGSLVVSGDAGMPFAREMESLAHRIWDLRDTFQFPIHALPPLQSLHQADQEATGVAPFFISDSADNVTAGSTGDNALMLQLALACGVENILFSAIIDPAAVEICFTHQVGDAFQLSVGGFYDEKSERVLLEQVELLAQFEEDGSRCRAVHLRHNAVEMLLFKKRRPVYTPEDLAHFGLRAEDYRIVIVKQGYLSPEFMEISCGFIMALTPGNCAQDLSLLAYQKRPQPMYPFEKVAHPDLALIR